MLEEKYERPSNAMANMFEAITESSQDIFYNDFPGTGKTLALIASCLNCIDTTINATQALLICGTMDSVFYAYSKTMELVNLIQPKINVRLVTETVFYNHDTLQTKHLLIGLSRAVIAINPDPNMLKLVCIDDAETVVYYRTVGVFLNLLGNNCCTIFVTSNYSVNLVNRIDGFGTTRKFILNLTNRLPPTLSYDFITLRDE